MTRVAFVILDGLPARHVGTSITPNLSALPGQAVGEAVMTSATYPNHATFITGRAPAEHGIVANWIVHDGQATPAHRVGPRTPTLFDTPGLRSTAVFGDHRLVGVMGARAATSHWPPEGKIPPGTTLDRYGYAADDEVVARVEDADAWDLLVVHLNEPDTAGHIDGPDSAAACSSYRSTDAALGRVIAALQPVWDSLVLIVVSDHDQLPVSDPDPIELDPPAGAVVIPEGSAAVVWGPTFPLPTGVAASSLAPDVTLLQAPPGRVFALPGGMVLAGHHGGADTRDQVVAVGGGDPEADALASSLAGTRPPATVWAPTMARLLAR